MHKLFVVVIILFGLNGRASLNSSVLQLRVLVSCPSIISLSETDKSDFLSGRGKEIYQKVGCSINDSRVVKHDLLLAKALHQQINPETTWYGLLPSRSWGDSRGQEISIALLKHHVEATIHYLKVVNFHGIQIDEEALLGIDYGFAFDLRAKAACLGRRDYKNCKRAYARVGEILSPRGAMLIPSHVEIPALLSNPLIQSRIHRIYERVAKIYYSYQLDRQDPGVDLFHIALEECEGSLTSALEILGFLLNREAKTMLTFGQLMNIRGLLTDEAQTSLKELTLIFPMSEAIDVFRSSKFGTRNKSFSFPKEIYTKGGHSYHFWSSAYIANRLKIEGFAIDHSFLAAQDFGRLYEALMSMGKRIHAIVDFLAGKGYTLDYSGFRYSDRDIAHHYFGAIWGLNVLDRKLPTLDIETYVDHYACLSVGLTKGQNTLVHWLRVAESSAKVDPNDKCEYQEILRDLHNGVSLSGPTTPDPRLVNKGLENLLRWFSE